MTTTVLICDHHLLFAESFASALRADGAQVRVAADPAEALAMLAAAPADRVVMSTRFPDDAGLEAVGQIRRTRPETHVSCLGAPDEPVAGAHAMLSKARPLAELVEAVLRGRAAARSHAVAATRRRTTVCTARVDAPTLAARFLTDRERDVLRLLVGAQQTNQIAEALGISVTTTRGYVQSILSKLGVHSRVQAVSYAVRHAVVS